MYLSSGLNEFNYLNHLMIVGSTTDKKYYIPYISATDVDLTPKEWLFDSFLLVPEVKNFSLGADINIGTTMSGEGDFYAVPCPNPGNKEAWLTAIDSLICGANTISTTIEELSKIIGKPERKRNLVVMLPYPGVNQCKFGMINGENLNFSVLGQNLTHATEDRYIACKWFVETFMAQWKKEAIDNLNLLGFYWPFETVYRGWNVDDHWLLKEIHRYINVSYNKKLFWIPFWASYNVHLLDDYQNYYFDAAFLQPNYMFYEKIKGVEEAAEAAKKRNAGIEMEYFLNLNEPIKVSQERHKRFREYLNGGVKYGYMDAACAWFVGGKIGEMLKDPIEFEFYQDIVDFVHKRYKIKNII